MGVGGLKSILRGHNPRPYFCMKTVVSMGTEKLDYANTQTGRMAQR